MYRMYFVQKILLKRRTSSWSHLRTRFGKQYLQEKN